MDIAKAKGAMRRFKLTMRVGARDRNRTGTPVIHEAADFKSDVSTYFTTRASARIFTHIRRMQGDAGVRGINLWRRGPESNRTNRICNPGHNRFATAPKKPPREDGSQRKREAGASLFWNVEREKSLELSTSTLARLRSTN